jgi:inner membrane protein
MASLVTHPIVPLAIAAVLGRKAIPLSVLLLGVLLSVFPDADSIGFRFGIPYSSPFGHRGFTHSIGFAFVAAALASLLMRKTVSNHFAIFIFLFVSMFSHGMLDAFTNHGNGVALLLPFSDTRFFFPFHPVEASPLSVQRFFTQRGFEILSSEAKWIWTPCIVFAMVGFFMRKQFGANNAFKADVAKATRL